MIVSASRRTDLPAFYGDWFAERLRAGFCHVPNPFNPKQVSRVSLRPGDVDAFVFWTRHPRSLLPHLSALDRREIPSASFPGIPQPPRLRFGERYHSRTER